jgi:hypothetical protein
MRWAVQGKNFINDAPDVLEERVLREKRCSYITTHKWTQALTRW